MDTKRILLPIPTYPDCVPEGTLASVFRLAQIQGAKITALVSQLDADRATWPAVMGAFPLDFPRMMQELVTRSELNATKSCSAVEKLSEEYGVTLDLRRGATTLYATPAGVIDLARLHDLVVLPVPEINSFDRSWIEPVVFQSGRPVMLMPSKGRQLQSVDRVVIAWDYSREAARALADALPLLRHARDVQVVTILGEKPIKSTSTAADIDKYLGAHKVRYTLHQISAGKEAVANLLQQHAQEVGACVLVMGCYGHSRAQEFLLGGASRGVIRDPGLPVLLSH
jgi:nucleotide-binding universal stress UspA family protein